ncbi:hypothetical protein GCM10028821_31270 [Hymenobacter jeollabukensis]
MRQPSWSTAYQNTEEIRFALYHREYGDRVLNQGPGKPPRIIPYIKDGYPIVYVLSKIELSIYKIAEKQKYIIYTKKLNEKQAKEFKEYFAKTDVTSLAGSSIAASVDDGFQVDVTVSKANNITTFRWSNVYIKPLVELLDIANVLSPNEFRFYKPSDKSLFVEQLRKNSQ